MSKRQQGHSQVTAAAKADISERSGRRIEKGERKSIPTEHNWRTRQDPLETVWEKELVPLLEKQGRLTGLTLWEYLEDEHPGEFPHSVLRTDIPHPISKILIILKYYFSNGYDFMCIR
jgi:hypothetical protein